MTFLLFTPWNLAALEFFGAMLALVSDGLACLVLGRSEKLRTIHLMIGGAF